MLSAEHAPRASASEMIAGVNGEISPEERRVLDHFFELFAVTREQGHIGSAFCQLQSASPPDALRGASYHGHASSEDHALDQRFSRRLDASPVIPAAGVVPTGSAG